MSRSDCDRLDDIIAAIDAIQAHDKVPGADEAMRHDAIRMRLVEIGEAVKAVSTDLLAAEPGIPWRQIARMRDRLTHRYFDTAPEIIRATAAGELNGLRAAASRIRDRLAPDED